MARKEKYKRSSVKFLFKHYNREKVGEDCITNPALTSTNYNLAPDDNKDQQARLESVIGNKASGVEGWAKCMNRANVNVMVTWIVTMPKDLAPDKEEAFFKGCYEFLAQRYGVKGEENIISAYVHRDEKTPHMHFAFVPVQEKNGVYKVNAKEVISLKDLKTFHKDLQEHLEARLGCVVNVRNGVTPKKSLSIRKLKENSELKQDTAKAKAVTSINEMTKLEKSISVIPEKTPSPFGKLLGEKPHGKQILMPYTDYCSLRKGFKMGMQALERLASVQERQSLIDILNRRITDIKKDNGKLEKENRELKQKFEELQNSIPDKLAAERKRTKDGLKKDLQLAEAIRQMQKDKRYKTRLNELITAYNENRSIDTSTAKKTLKNEQENTL